jgi:cupin 2 domain-containing protein
MLSISRIVRIGEKTTMNADNIFDDSRPPGSGECFREILHHRNCVIERIVSSSDLVPEECVQRQDEWVLLVRGSAELRVRDERVSLHAGDYLFLPAETPHSVMSASEGAMWLAVHLYPEKED